MNTGISGENIFNHFKSIDIFSDLSTKEARMLYSRMNFRAFATDEYLFHEGDAGVELFIITSGSVSISVNLPDGKELVLSRINEGNFFGEMSIIDQSPRSATCKTLEKTECLCLHANEFNTLMKDHPLTAGSIMNRMISIAAQRLANNGSFLSQMVQWGDASRKRAITDPATSLFNRRYMDDSFASLVTRAKLDGKHLSFVMFDLDHFGALNAKYGLEFGDRIIVTAADTFRKNFRENDILVRYGGDEFVFILPDVDSSTTQTLCDNLCHAFRNLHFLEHPDLHITCSLGFSCFPDHATTHEALMEKADRALYAAKSAGRDRALGFH